jgi:predicted house-cleaning noncanonical NTP pyrophosphatase (MazG superfamily)
MPTYNKLVRDLIPEIIAANGKKYHSEILDNQTYLEKLDLKLQEELDEYYQNQDITELADLLEVIYAAAKARGINEQELERIRIDKQKQRGGFERKIFLIDVED